MRARTALGALLGVVLTVPAVAVATAAPAGAETKTFADAKGDAPKRIDVRRVRVKHGPKNIKVVVRYTKLLKKDQHQHDLALWLATKPGKRPQYLVGASAYHLYFGETRGWRLKQPKKHPYGNINCDSGYRYRAGKDRIVFKFPRTCIGSPKRIRVAVSAGMVVYDETGNPKSYGPDDLVAAKHLTAWVRSPR